jgi:sugar lactone lactonase YvrE
MKNHNELGLTQAEVAMKAARNGPGGRSSIQRTALVILVGLLQACGSDGGPVAPSPTDIAVEAIRSSVPLQHVYVLPSGQHPENVTFDPDARNFYVSHFTGFDGAGVLRVGADGEFSTLVASSALPYPGTAGLRFDRPRGLIWVCVDDIFAFRQANGNAPPFIPSSAFLPRESYLMAFDLNGVERQRIAFTGIPGMDPDAPKLCNDLVVDEEDGAIFATDSYSGNLIRVDGSTGEARILLQDDRLRDTRPVPLMAIGANGIALDRGWVYVTVAYSGVLLRVRQNGTDVQAVALSEPVFGDGLVFAHHVGFAVSSPPGLPRELVQIVLDGAESAPTATVSHLPWPPDVTLISPAAGTVVDGRYYIADGYFPAFSRPTVPGQFFGVDLPEIGQGNGSD